MTTRTKRSVANYVVLLHADFTTPSVEIQLRVRIVGARVVSSAVCRGGVTSFLSLALIVVFMRF